MRSRMPSLAGCCPVRPSGAIFRTLSWGSIAKDSSPRSFFASIWPEIWLIERAKSAPARWMRSTLSAWFTRAMTGTSGMRSLRMTAVKRVAASVSRARITAWGFLDAGRLQDAEVHHVPHDVDALAGAAVHQPHLLAHGAQELGHLAPHLAGPADDEVPLPPQVHLSARHLLKGGRRSRGFPRRPGCRPAGGGGPSRRPRPARRRSTGR